jgi:4-diphosphocytidyl-2-C-methyl-D-erythritol kinase
VLTLNSFAKLNLYLAIRNRRRDGFHTLNTIFERIDLTDKIVLKPLRNKKIRIVSSSAGLPKGSSNLCFRAAKLLQDRLQIKEGVEIRIVKRIPIGSGMGGGSSNAASVLIGLNRLWKLKFSKDKLARLAAKIGSDVPFFVYDCPFALGKAKGDKISPLKQLDRLRLWHVLVVPKISVSTPLVYKKWDDLKAGARKANILTRPAYSVNIMTSALRKNDFSLLSKAVFNSLEPVTAKLYPEVARIKAKLLKSGAQSILMSGSGPAVFGIVSSRKEAVRLRRQLGKVSRLWQVFLTRTR